jgi:hypothetical protein
MLVWYCELLSAKCLPLYLTKVPSRLVGCNLDNPTDNSTSTYAAQTLQNLKKIGVTSTSARSDYVAIGPRAFVAFLTVSLFESCRTMLVWYCELLPPKCLPLYLTKVPSLL